MSSTCFTANCTSLATLRPVLGVTPLRRAGMSKRTGFVVTSPQRSSVRRDVAVDAAGVVEIAQIAEADAGLIWSTAAIAFACVLVVRISPFFHIF